MMTGITMNFFAIKKNRCIAKPYGSIAMQRPLVFLKKNFATPFTSFRKELRLEHQMYYNVNLAL